MPFLEPRDYLMLGLILIAVGSGGIKPCVSAHVGDQNRLTNAHSLERIFGWFYFPINLGAFASTLLTPYLLAHEDFGPAWAFGIPGVLMAIATVLFFGWDEILLFIYQLGKFLYKRGFLKGRFGIVD